MGNPLQILQQALQEATQTGMPFGKYGPQNYPPHGVPLADLPFEYLQWFQRRGFPPGRLGELLELVLNIKRDGAEEVFSALRGGRPAQSLRQPQRRKWDFQ
ncbi:MAG: DUF3820 family protein [Oligosphaeraceae bacterium]|nr:DUF3820 family protein [Oligosphaeraceae bacterium]